MYFYIRIGAYMFIPVASGGAAPAILTAGVPWLFAGRVEEQEPIHEESSTRDKE